MKTKLFFALVLVTMLSLTMMATASAALPSGLSWVKYGSNPVVTGSSPCTGPSEAVHPSIVFESTNNYKMYYAGRSDGDRPYLATTTNGGTSWSCGGGPLLTLGGSGAWDQNRIAYVSVIKDGSTYKMWYSGRDTNANWAIGYATSGDGISWTKQNGGNPVLQKGSYGAWDSYAVREPTVIKVGSIYHMWYAGVKYWPYFNIGHATSNDGITWAKDASPALTGTAGTWDATEVYSPNVVFNTVDSSYEMFYSGAGGNLWLTGHANATSPSGPWTKDANAILSPSATGWEAGNDSLDYAGAVLDGTTWKVFFPSGGTYRIGLATLMNQAQMTFSPLAKSIAVGSDVTINIDLTSVTDLYGYQFQVNYDPSIVSVTNAGFVNTFFNTSTGNALIPGGWNATCSGGVCQFAATRESAAAGYTGSGTLAQITFHALAAGSAPLTFSSDILSVKNATPILHTSNTGFLTVYGTATLNGVVNLQGRTYPTDTPGTVTLFDENGIAPLTVVPFSLTDGSWNATVQVAGSTTYTVIAHHSLYLDNQETTVAVSAGGSYLQPITMLLGGDANNDGTIGIGDLTCVGGDFGGTNHCTGGSSDINADGNVNILDLVLVGGNYNLSSPQGW